MYICEKNPENLKPRAQFKQRYSLPTVPISLGFVALLEKNYDGEPILTVFSLIEEDVLVKGFV